MRTDTVSVTEVGKTPLFKVGDVLYVWNDVVAWARSRGDWQQLESDVLAGDAALLEAEPSPEEIESAAREFRYERGLLAADELDAWLGARGLAGEDWEAYLRRSLAREARPVGTAGGAHAPVFAAAWAEGMCSGRLEELASELALRVAVAPEAPLERLDDELDAFRRSSATEDAVVREVESNRLEWVRIRFDLAAFEDEDAAREAALCVRADGEPLAAVAGRIGVELDECDEWLEELDPELASRVLAADPGDLVGPVPTEDGLLLAHVLGRTAPSPADERVRARAAETVAARAAARMASERVSWLERL